MSSYQPISHHSRPLPAPHPSRQEAGSSTPARSSWQQFDNDLMDDDFNKFEASSVPLQTLRARAPQSVMSSVAGEYSGMSINGRDEDVHTFGQMGAFASLLDDADDVTRRPGPTFLDQTQGGYGQAEAGLGAARRPTRTCRWVTAGVVAVLAGAGVGLGVYFGKVRPDALRDATGSGPSTSPSPNSSSRGISSVLTSANSVTSSLARNSSSVGSSSIASSSISSSSTTTSRVSSSPINSATSTVAPTSSVSSVITSILPTSVSVPGAQASGLLRSGTYAVNLKKTTDNCGSMNFSCSATVAETWIVSNTNGAYAINLSNRKQTVTPTLSPGGGVTFSFAELDVAAPNACLYDLGTGFSLSLGVSALTGIVSEQRTLVSACRDNRGNVYDKDQECTCLYEVSASV